MADFLHYDLGLPQGPEPWACSFMKLLSLLEASEPSSESFHSSSFTSVEKYLENYPAVSGIFEVKVTKYQKAQQSFWKSFELVCVSLLSSYEAPKLIFDHLLFVLFLISIAS